MRTDVTLDAEECLINMIQSGPSATCGTTSRCRMRPAPSSSRRSAPRTFTVQKPKVPLITYRQIIAIGVDGSSGNNEYFAVGYARSLMVKPDKEAFQAKAEVQNSLTAFDSYPDRAPGSRCAVGVRDRRGAPRATPPASLVPTSLPR